MVVDVDVMAHGLLRVWCQAGKETMNKTIIPVCLVLACGCAGQHEASGEKTTPVAASSVTAKTASPAQAEEKLPPTSMPGDEVVRMTIFGVAPSNAWPDVEARCLFTGVVLTYDRFSMPHRILLENMCLQKRDGSKNVYEGEHLWCEANVHGHFEIPFLSAHIEEKEKRLIFVTELEGRRIEESLLPGSYTPGTLSFENSLDSYDILSIKK